MSGDTDATMMDYYQPTEHLSIVGSTYDSDVAGQSLTTKQAYFAMFQGLSMNIEWIKSFSEAEEVRSVAFSSDGQLLLIHASTSSSQLNMIISARVTNGELINAFSYSNQIGKLEFNTRNQVFPQNYGTYSAIFQAPYLTGGGVHSGFILLGHAFTLATPSSSIPLLRLRSLSQASSNDLPLGLALSPQDPSSIYSFSQQGTSPSGDKFYKVARIQISGNIEQFCYEFSTPSNVAQQSQVFEVASTSNPNEEVVFVGIASFSSEVKIGRLVVDTASNAVTSSKVVSDDTQWSGASIGALHIVNENQVSLLVIKDFKMYIISHDYSSMSSSGQQMLPPLTQDVLRLSRFISQNKFFALTVGNQFNVDESPSSAAIGSKKHAILLNSDYQDGCYGGSAAVPISTNLVLDTNSISATSTSSFQSVVTSGVTLAPLSLTITDYDPTRITNIDSTCSATNGPFKLNSVVQTKNTFEYFSGLARTFVIVPFSASMTCATQTPVFTYIGYDDTARRFLKPSDFIQVNPSNGAISVTSSGTVGTTLVSVLGKVQSGQQLVETFTLVGKTNSAPFFQSPLATQTVAIMSKLTYTLPGITDVDNDQVTFTAFKTIDQTSLPSFITTSLTSVIIYPTQYNEVGSLSVTLRLDDSINKVDFAFNVIVTNLPPKLDVGQAFTDITIDQLSNQLHPIPNYSDPEGLHATLVVVSPSFVTEHSKTQLRIQPTSVSLSKNVTVTIKIQDGQPKATTYSFTITFSNVAPQYSLTPQIVSVFQTKPYQIAITELESESWTSSFQQSPTTAASFVSLTNNSMTFSPNSYDVVGTYTITITVIDQSKYSNVQSFQLTVTNAQPIFTGVLDSVLHIHLGQDYYYTLPGTFDQESQPVVVSLVSPPSFVSLPSQTQLKVSTGGLAGLKTYQIGLELSDGSVNKGSYSMSLVVGNCAPTLVSPVGDQTLSVFGKTTKTPKFSDIDNDPLTLSMTPVLSFVSIDGLTITMNPNDYQYVGSHSLTVIASDNGTLSAQESFIITVNNLPPRFVDSKEPKTMDYEYLETNTYILPATMDPEGQPFTVIVESLPKIMTQDSPTTFTVKTSTIEDIADYQLKIKLEDGQPKSTLNIIPIRIMSPPLFLKPLEDQKVRLKSVKLVDMIIKHPRNLSFTTVVSGTQVALEFISLKGYTSLQISPSLPTQIGIHTVQIKAIGQDSRFIVKTMKVTVYNDPPIFSDKKPQNQKIRINKATSYRLPDFKDLENQEVFVEHARIPPFCKFSGQTYTCEPTKDVGNFDVFGQLSDGFEKTQFFFAFEVFNTAPFIKEKLSLIRLIQGETLSYHLPKPEDEENQKIKITVQERVTETLPDFMKFHPDIRTLTFFPTYSTNAQKYLIDVILSDSIAPEVSYSFTVEILPANQERQEMKASTSNLTVLGRIKCTHMGRDSRVILQISPTSESLMQHIVENSFTVTILGKGNAKYQIIKRDADSGDITLALLLEEYSDISTGTEPDTIEVLLGQQFEEAISNKIIVFNKGLKATRSIPPQVSQKMKSIAQTLEGGKVNMFESTTSNFMLSIGIQFFWGFLFDISFITINTMISMPVPGITQIIQQVFLNLIYADLLMTEKWLPQLFSKDRKSQISEGGINSFFEENGFESYDLINNLGSNFVYFALYLGILGLFTLFRLFSLLFTSLSPIRLKCDIWMLSLTSMVINSQLPPLSLSAMINLYQLSYETTLQKVSSALSIAITVLIPMALVASVIVLRTQEGEGVKKMVEGLNTTTVIGKYWQVIVNVRWIITNAIMVSLRQWHFFQLQILLVLSIISQCLLISGHPLYSHFDNYFSLVLEFAVSCYLYLLLALSDFQGSSNPRQRDLQGWALAVLTILVVGTNTLILLLQKASSTFLFIKRLILKKLLSQRATIAIKPRELPVRVGDASYASSRDITAMDVNEFFKNSEQSQRASFEVKNYYQRGMPKIEVSQPKKYYSRVIKQRPDIEDSEVVD